MNKKSKGTGLSDVERLGEWSMPGKAGWIFDFQDKNIGQPSSVMVLLYEFYRVNIALAGLKVLISYLVIYIEVQIMYIFTTKDSLQLVGQNSKPKTEDRGTLKNWGFPKGGNSYFYNQKMKQFVSSVAFFQSNKAMPFSVSYRRGNGAFVVWATKTQINSSKGMQSSKIFTNLSGSIRNFSTGPEKLTNLDIKQEIECSYKQLFDINIFKSAYHILKSNPGMPSPNMSKSTDNKTLDGRAQELSLVNDWAYIRKTIQELKDRTFQFKPTLRVLIPKPNGKTRPLGIPSPRDKVVQQVFKLILEPAYEPIFSKLSHGFRPNKSTITAISEIRKWNGVTFIIQGDIKGYFDNIDPHILATLLKKRIKDSNLIDLYWKLVKAGYVNDGNYSKTEVGFGGILSPLLSNICLHEFDLFMESLIKKYTDLSLSLSLSKRVSKLNPEYFKIRKEIKNINSKSKKGLIFCLGKTKELGRTPKTSDPNKNNRLNTLKKLLVKTPSDSDREMLCIKESVISSPLCSALGKGKCSADTGSRVYYNRYADEWLVGVTGNKELAIKIKEEIKNFLLNYLSLTLKEEKIKISHMSNNSFIFHKSEIIATKYIHIFSCSEKINYLGFVIWIRYRKYTESQLSVVRSTSLKQIRRPNFTSIIIEAPIDKLINKLVSQGYAWGGNKPKPKAITKWIYMRPEDIVLRYNTVIREILNYYSPIDNRNQLSYIIWILKFSAVFTLARKLNISPKKVWQKYGNPITVKFTSNNKERSIKLYQPKSLSRDRTWPLK